MRISVVMPALDEAANMAARGRELREQSDDAWEWIVADGGSTDATVECAIAAGARVVRSPRGRGLQLDAGARLATGDILLFLHADTKLPREAFSAIRDALQRPDVVGGNFRLRFDERTVVATFFETVYATRQRLLQTFFGDSAIFVRRTIYDRIGGFGDAPIMEDYAFSVALRKAGRTVRLPIAVHTSARRYQRRPLRTLWTWISIMTLYRLGVSPARLARSYRPHEIQNRPPPV